MNNQLLAEKCETFLKEFVDSQVDFFLEDDSYYQHMATPLKSAEHLKQEHRNRIKKSLLMKEYRESIAKAVALILSKMSHYVRPEEFEKVKSEMEHIIDHLANPVEVDMGGTEEAQPLLFRKLWGISNDTLLHIHHFANALIQQKHYNEANHVLTFLVTVAPDIAGFWTSRGICLQALHHDDEAFQVFNVSRILAPEDPIPIIYICNGYLRLKDKKKAADELKKLEDCLHHHPDQKKTWHSLWMSLKDHLHRL